MRGILRSSFSIDKDLSLQVQGGGCGIAVPAGGWLEKPDIRNIIPEVSQAVRQRRETGEDWACMRDIRICFRLIGIWN
jgi:hypothetical protein